MHVPGMSHDICQIKLVHVANFKLCLLYSRTTEDLSVDGPFVRILHKPITVLSVIWYRRGIEVLHVHFESDIVHRIEDGRPIRSTELAFVRIPINGRICINDPRLLFYVCTKLWSRSGQVVPTSNLTDNEDICICTSGEPFDRVTFLALLDMRR